MITSERRRSVAGQQHYSRMALRRVLGMLLAVALGVSGGLTPARAQVTLRIWYTERDGGLLAALAESYGEARDGRVQIELRHVPALELVEQLAAPPDGLRPNAVIASSATIGTLVSNRLLAQLDPKLSADFRANAADIAWQAVTYDGRILGIPYRLEGVGLYINHNLVSEAPATLDALLDNAEAQQQTGKRGWIVSLDFYPTAGILHAFGGEALDTTGIVRLGDSDGTTLRRYLETLQRIGTQRGVVADGTAIDFAAGDVAYFLGGTWELPRLRERLGNPLGVTRLPTVDGATWQPYVGAMAVMALLNDNQQDGVLDFARYLIEPEAQRILAGADGVPVNRAAFEIDPLTGAFAAQFTESGKALPNRLEMQPLWHSLNLAIGAVRASTPSEEAARTLLEALAASKP